MADFIQNMTGTVELDNSLVLEFAETILVAKASVGIADQLVSLPKEVNGKSVTFTKYDNLNVDTTPLNEREDVASEKLSDSDLVMTTREYGKVVTTTSLANLQTGGKADAAAGSLIGLNMGRTQNKLALNVLEASTNIMYAGAATTRATIAAGHIMDGDVMAKVYNKLSRASVPGLPQAGGKYVALMHNDVISDIKESAAWIDVSKYANPESILNNEIGMFKGFRILEDNTATIIEDGGVTTTDVYKTVFMGFNALGKGESLPCHIRVTDGGDSLKRFQNIGWYGVLDYKIIDQDALYVVESASAFGA
jgi:N4-gp56 family major capsid protein